MRAVIQPGRAAVVGDVRHAGVGERLDPVEVDPVPQQVEVFGDPTMTVSDAFRPVTRYWDRITHPAQILQSSPKRWR